MKFADHSGQISGIYCGISGFLSGFMLLAATLNEAASSINCDLQTLVGNLLFAPAFFHKVIVQLVNVALMIFTGE